MRMLGIVIAMLFALALEAAPLQQLQPWLGIEVDTAVKDAVGAKRVIEGSPAKRAGLEPGDRITAIDSEVVKTRDELMTVLKNKGVGTTVKVHFMRKDAAQKKDMKLEVLPDMLDLAKAQLVGKSAPPFEVLSLDGKSIRNTDLKGKILVLEFWATWCPACRAAAPFISKWAAAHPSIQVLGVSDEEAAVLNTFQKREKLAYPLATDPSGNIQVSFGMGSIPAFILIDKQGIVRNIAVGVGDYLAAFLNEADALAKAP